MKNKIYSFLALLLGFVFFVSCSKADAESASTFSVLSDWPLLVLATLCAIASVPHDESSDKVGMRAIAVVIGKLAQLGGLVLCIAGFWRWDFPWWITLSILLGYGVLANSTSNASNKGLGAIFQLICAILAVAACVFAYIKLW